MRDEGYSRAVEPGGDGSGQLPFLPSGDPSRRPLAGLKVVAIGGGTGLPIVLSGLKLALGSLRRAGDDPRLDSLTAIVTVADDGGSSGRLREAYGVVAPGDVRNCLLALSDDRVMTALFGFRFAGSGDLAGHSLGNLILTALNLMHGDFSQAVERAAQILAVSGRVLAATPSGVALAAELQDGRRVRGETAIRRAGGRIRRLRLEPGDARPLPAALDALREADLVVIGPGSLYTSLIPPLLVRELPEAVAASGARVALVMNLMAERGESDGLTAAEHVKAVIRHAPRLPIHDVLVNSAPIPEPALERYALEGGMPVVCDRREIESLGCRAIQRSLLAEGPKLRHDPRALAAALLQLAAEPTPAARDEREARGLRLVVPARP
jgi:uncharacterized cofD-like protein